MRLLLSIFIRNKRSSERSNRLKVKLTREGNELRRGNELKASMKNVSAGVSHGSDSLEGDQSGFVSRIQFIKPTQTYSWPPPSQWSQPKQLSSQHASYINLQVQQPELRRTHILPNTSAKYIFVEHYDSRVGL